jgi:hypothetical protein
VQCKIDHASPSVAPRASDHGNAPTKITGKRLCRHRSRYSPRVSAGSGAGRARWSTAFCAPCEQFRAMMTKPSFSGRKSAGFSGAGTAELVAAVTARDCHGSRDGARCDPHHSS